MDFVPGQTVVTTHGTPTVPYGTKGIVVGLGQFAHGSLVVIGDEQGKTYEVNAIYVRALEVPTLVNALAALLGDPRAR